jgi:type IV secretion system protein VirB6
MDRVTSDALIPALMTEVNALLSDYSEMSYEALSRYLFHPATILATIYFAIQGMRLLLGELNLTFSVLFKTILRIGFIFTLMGTGGWQYIAQYCYEFLNQLSLDLGQVLLEGVSTAHSKNLFDGLQDVLNQFSTIGFNFFMQGHFYHWLPYLNGLLVWAVGFLMVAVGLFHLIVAKVLFSILLAILPLILLACFFDRFYSIFDRWVGFIVSIFLLQILIYAVLAFEITLSHWWVDSFQLSGHLLSHFKAIPLIIFGVISVGLMGKMSTLAYGIGAGVASVSAEEGSGAWIGRNLWGRSRGPRS